MKQLEYMIPMNDGIKLYTVVLTPDDNGKHPAAFSRSPYDDLPTDEALRDYRYKLFTDAGYVLIHQSCRGTWKSEGECVPFHGEREDGLATLDWIRRQQFYNGEIYVHGESYCNFVHLSYLDTKPEDIKAAFLAVMPSNMYRGLHTNGLLNQDILVPWYISLYRKNQLPFDQEELYRNYPADMRNKDIRDYIEQFIPGGCGPLMSLLKEDETGEEWSAPGRTGDSLSGYRSLTIPTLICEAWYDIYIGQARSVWNELPEETRARSAMMIGPWAHDRLIDDSWDIRCPGGEQPVDLDLDWFEHVRKGISSKYVSEGEIRYYTLGESVWKNAPDLPGAEGGQVWYLNPAGKLEKTPGDRTLRSFRYNPSVPTHFNGCSNVFASMTPGVRADIAPDSGEDLISFISDPLEETITCTGDIGVALTVQSDCGDTAFFVRVDVLRDGKYLPVQESITMLRNFTTDYHPGEEIHIRMNTDATSWQFRKGDRIRVDVASSNWPSYQAHTNAAGDLWDISNNRIATNTVVTGESFITLPVEKAFYRQQ